MKSLKIPWIAYEVKKQIKARWKVYAETGNQSDYRRIQVKESELKYLQERGG